MNFFKSNIFGVNVHNNFLEGATSFLHCKVCSLHFTYLGLLVNANPRCTDTMMPMLKAIENWLLSWRSCSVA